MSRLLAILTALLLALLASLHAAEPAPTQEPNSENPRLQSLASQVGFLRQFVVESGLPYAASGTVVQNPGEPPHVLLNGPWGIQWHFDPAQFLPRVAYDVFVEYWIPERLVKDAQHLTFSFYSFEQANPAAKSNGVVIPVKDSVVAKWSVARVCSVSLAEKNGYFFADVSPASAITSGDGRVQVRRFWAAPGVETPDDLRRVEEAHKEFSLRQACEQRFMDGYQPTRFRTAEKQFLFGAFVAGAQFEAPYYGLEFEEYLRFLLRGVRDCGFNEIAYPNIVDPKSLRSLLRCAAQYGLQVHAGGPGGPLSVGSASPAALGKVDWEVLRQKVKAITDARSANLAGYYPVDEFRNHMTEPVLRMVKLFEEFDPITPAVPNCGDVKSEVFGKLPIVCTTVCYPFRASQMLGIPEQCRFLDKLRRASVTQGPTWGFFQTYGNKSGSWRMPTASEAEAQVFSALAARCQGMNFYMFHCQPDWMRHEVNLVDSYMLPLTPVVDTLAGIASSLRGIGEELANSEYVEDVESVVEARIPTFTTHYEGRPLDEIHPKAKVGVFRIPNEQGVIVVIANLDVHEATSLHLAAKTGILLRKTAYVWKDLLRLSDTDSASNGLPVKLKAGQGSVLWFGPAEEWRKLQDRIVFARALWQSQKLAEDLATAAHYLKGLPDASFLRDCVMGAGRTSYAGIALASELQKAENAFDKLRAGNNAYAAAETRLGALREELSRTSRELPFETAGVLTKKESLPPAKQRLLEASGVYFRLLLKHWDTGVSPQELKEASVSIRNMLAEIRRK